MEKSSGIPYGFRCLCSNAQMKGISKNIPEWRLDPRFELAEDFRLENETDYSDEDLPF